MPLLSDIPVELLLDNLLPALDISDLLSLASTNRFYAALCNDDTFWKRKLQEDFNFSGAETARTSGWKFIYKGLHNPKVFVWGERSNGRLGLPHLPRSTFGEGVPTPTQLRIPGARIVGLTAGGMNFHALDSRGDVYVWGTLQGQAGALNSDGFSVPEKSAPTPLKLELPAATRSISCGRLHSMTLDVNSNIWTFLSWGRPFRLVTPLLDASSPDSTPEQIDAGWSFASVLTKAGDVFIWWPFSDPMRERIDSCNEDMDRDGNKKAQATNGNIPCVTWDMSLDPFRLPAIPPLPELQNMGISEEKREEETKLIKIAALDNMIIGLTNKGHVLQIQSLANDETSSQAGWEYLPNFSELEKVREHSAFCQDKEDRIEVPSTMHITHISAQFQTFIAYSTGESSIVLMGSTSTRPDDLPTVLPEIQNRSIISVVLGDYHYGALTSTGKLLTWGAFSNGAIGLGDPTSIEPGQPGGFATAQQRERASQRRFGTPPRVDVPSEVRFDWELKNRKDRFCFHVAAGGWHTGALVIDLDPGDEAEEEYVPEGPSQGPTPSAPELPRQEPGGIPLFPRRGRGILSFRIGFAGRGRGLGRGGNGDA